jgi:hypothetical protein
VAVAGTAVVGTAADDAIWITFELEGALTTDELDCMLVELATLDDLQLTAATDSELAANRADGEQSLRVTPTITFVPTSVEVDDGSWLPIGVESVALHPIGNESIAAS